MNALPHGPMLADPIGEVLAEELIELSKQLADLAYDLGSETETLRRHMTSLQSIDRITQVQLAIADLLRSTEPWEERLDAITLEALSASIRTRLGAAQKTE